MKVDYTRLPLMTESDDPFYTHVCRLDGTLQMGWRIIMCLWKERSG